MPAIETELLIDALLGVIVLLFVPFGVRRGVAKEAFVSGGILLGAVIAAAWTERGAEELRGWFDLGRDTSRFAVAVAAVLGSTLLLGYGGGAALGRVRQGVLARLAGGLLAALNGALLLAFGYDFLQRYLWADDGLGPFDDGVLGRTLARDFDWLLLGAEGLLVLSVVVGLIVTSIRGRHWPLDGVDPDGPGGPVPPRQRPVRLARGADAGKYEPTPGIDPLTAPDPRPGRFGGSTSPGATTPLFDRPAPRPPGDAPERGTGTWPQRGALDSFPTTNGHAASPAVADEWLRRAAAMTRPAESAAAETGDEPPVTGSAGARFGDVGDTGQVGGGLSDAVTPRLCPNCGAAVGPGDGFCLECGQTL